MYFEMSQSSLSLQLSLRKSQQFQYSVYRWILTVTVTVISLGIAGISRPKIYELFTFRRRGNDKRKVLKTVWNSSDSIRMQISTDRDVLLLNKEFRI